MPRRNSRHKKQKRTRGRRNRTRTRRYRRRTPKRREARGLTTPRHHKATKRTVRKPSRIRTLHIPPAQIPVWKNEGEENDNSWRLRNRKALYARDAGPEGQTTLQRELLNDIDGKPNPLGIATVLIDAAGYGGKLGYVPPSQRPSICETALYYVRKLEDEDDGGAKLSALKRYLGIGPNQPLSDAKVWNKCNSYTGAVRKLNLALPTAEGDADDTDTDDDYDY